MLTLIKYYKKMYCLDLKISQQQIDNFFQISYFNSKFTKSHQIKVKIIKYKIQ